MHPLLSEVLGALRHAEMTSCFSEPGTPEYRTQMEAKERLHALYWTLTHAGPLTDAQEEEARRDLTAILAPDAAPPRVALSASLPGR